LTLLCKPYGLAYLQGGLKVRGYSCCQRRVQRVCFLQVGLKAYQKRHDNRSFTLSTSPQDIYTFPGLDYRIFNEGFSTRLAIFDWLATSRFFQPVIFLRMGNSMPERKVYQEFVSYEIARAPPASCLYLDEPGDSAADSEERAMRLGINTAAAIEGALAHFGCCDEWYMIASLP